ncbi:MAG: 2,3-bisphosphoglycerate-independent phosphoglycerate mutase [Candidatus Azobacteroides pseudotrichonymphae]|jgi:2,3-bisphosphoglycerate-independent phosphoglycerate mutase|nr:MAG: 2,3-bisphosphoglycerate-independent phosphoglycerate mutase [Candidatus Azobacteroides pseudotrichonymphae]
MAKKKVLLVILDGWGCGDHTQKDVIYSTTTPYWDYLLENYPNSQLQASGEDVGLPSGQMGNSEVGHLNIGAGRIVHQDLVKINTAIQNNSILENLSIQKAYSYAKENNKQVHLMGLVSNGGVHSSLRHLFKLIDISKFYDLYKVFVHCFLDGRDTDPKSGIGFIKKLEAHLRQTSGQIASVIGRYYAMDRDKRWERIREAYNLLVRGIGTPTENLIKSIEQFYLEGITDEFMKPLVCIKKGKPVAIIEKGDVVLFFNYRNDRAKELTVVFSQQDMPEQGMTTIPDLQYFTMTPYDPTFKNIHILFDKENLNNTLGEFLSNSGLKQLRIAETEKYAHVTFFFNGGREVPYKNEKRILVDSPKVATYDLKPEMSAYEIKDRLIESIQSQQFDFIVVNYANGDMVGHTGIYKAIEKTVIVVDECLKDTIETAKSNGYNSIVIADHGNADYALNNDGTPNTAHSLNPVPFIFISENKNAIVESGKLADVAPSILHILGLKKPQEMTGKNLVKTE